MELSDIIGIVIAIAVGSIIAAAIIPSAITDITGVNTTTWNSATQSVWGLMGVVIALGCLMIFLRTIK